MKAVKASPRPAADVSIEALTDHTLHIARQVRLSGSPEERTSFRYIGRQLAGWGFEIEEHRPECWTSWPGAALLEIVDEPPLTLRCITHAMAASTPDEGLVLELVDADAPGSGVAAKAAVTDGMAMPSKVFALERAGAAAQIYVCGEHLHEMITSIVWGSPTPETAPLLPRTPIVSVTRDGGKALREALAHAPVSVRIRAKVDTAWRRLPILIAHLRAPRSDGDFLLFSGHVDSWHYGAMDNASANAVQLEVGRLAALRRRQLKRDLRLAFWSGHSHGRYAGSAWYADQFWRDLHDHCVLHLNVDSVGATGAALLGEAIAMAETRGFASEILERLTGQRLRGARPQRAGDQSFWGPGVPSLFMTLSEQPADDSPAAEGYAQLMGGQARSGGLGWWWHTPEDTLDKLDPAHLERDARVYAEVARRVLEDPVLPLDYRAWVGEARETLAGYGRAARRRFDLAPVLQALEALEEGLGRLYRQAGSRSLGAVRAGLINRCLMTLGRELIPVSYCRAERFEHDHTLAVPPFPGLEPMGRLGALDPKGDEARQLRVGLVRQRNKVEHHLRRADEAVRATLAVLRAATR